VNSHRGDAIERGAEGAPLRDLGQRLLDASYLEGDFLLRSGRRSKFYLDKYLFSTRPDLLRDIAAGLAQKLSAYEPFDLLAGPELGAVAIVAAVSLAYGKPFVIVRKGQKGYGTDKAMEGKAEPGQRVVMVEDVVTSGGAALMAADKLREAGLTVQTLLCVVDREEGGRAQIEAEGLTLDPLFTATSLGIKKPE
jgi:orotate phosphoribosyltransferase